MARRSKTKIIEELNKTIERLQAEHQKKVADLEDFNQNRHAAQLVERNDAINKYNAKAELVSEIKKIVFAFIRWDSDKTDAELVTTVRTLKSEHSDLQQKQGYEQTAREQMLELETDKLWHLVRSLSGDRTLQEELSVTPGSEDPGRRYNGEHRTRKLSPFERYNVDKHGTIH